MDTIRLLAGLRFYTLMLCLGIPSAIVFSLLGNTRRKSVTTLGKKIAGDKKFSQHRRYCSKTIAHEADRQVDTSPALPSFNWYEHSIQQVTMGTFYYAPPLWRLSEMVFDWKMLFAGCKSFVEICSGDPSEVLDRRKKWAEAHFKQCMWDVMQLETFWRFVTDRKFGTTQLSVYHWFIIAVAFRQPALSQ